MDIALNIVKYYLRNAYFITGTAYAGKSTMVKMLAEKYDMIFCGENYISDVSDKIADPAYQKDLCYIPQLKDFSDFVKRTPEEYERWIFSVQKEVAGLFTLVRENDGRDTKEEVLAKLAGHFGLGKRVTGEIDD